MKTCTVDMGIPVFERSLIPMNGPGAVVLNEAYTVPVTGQRYEKLSSINTGVPHATLWVDDITTARVEQDGPHIVRDASTWPHLVNAGFGQIISRTHISMRFFERGAGVTLACGSGACAAVSAGVAASLLDANVDVRCDMPGGRLDIRCTVPEGGGHPTRVHMTGPAAMVYTARLDQSAL